MADTEDFFSQVVILDFLYSIGIFASCKILYAYENRTHAKCQRSCGGKDDRFAESFKQIKTSIGNCGSKLLLVFKSC